MGQVESTTIHNHLVLRDNLLTHRWYDAWGPSVVKYLLNPAAIPTDNTTGMPTEFTNTLVNASTFTVTDVAGGAVLLTTAAANNDGVKLQLGAELAGSGENVSFAADYPTYFGIQFAIDDATNTDILAGFCVTDTTCLDGVDTAMYFRSIDTDPTLYFVLEQDTNESATAVATLANATNIHCEFLYSAHNVYVYVNDVLTATIADTDANFPNDELMRLTLEFLTGAAGGASTCTVRELSFIQIQA
jgi:hypothetical protein